MYVVFRLIDVASANELFGSESLFNASKEAFKETNALILGDLNSNRKELQLLHVEIGKLVEMSNGIN